MLREMQSRIKEPFYVVCAILCSLKSNQESRPRIRNCRRFWIPWTQCSSPWKVRSLAFSRLSQSSQLEIYCGFSKPSTLSASLLAIVDIASSLAKGIFINERRSYVQVPLREWARRAHKSARGGSCCPPQARRKRELQTWVHEPQASCCDPSPVAR